MYTATCASGDLPARAVKSPKPKRFFPAVSTDTDGASTGPPWPSLAEIGERLAGGLREVLGLGHGGRRFSESSSSPPQPATSAHARRAACDQGSGRCARAKRRLDERISNRVCAHEPRSTHHRRIQRHRPGHRPGARPGRLRHHALGAPARQARGRRAGSCADEGIDVLAVPANMADEDDIKNVVAAHRERFGRLDVLVNNAGIGIGAAVADTETKKLDIQLDVNLRGVYLMARECIPMLKEAGAEHRKALMANTASIAGQVRAGLAGRLLGHEVRRGGPEPGAAQGAGRRRRPGHGVLPRLRGHADDRLGRGSGPEDEMIQPEDIAEAVRFLLRTSPSASCRRSSSSGPSDTQPVALAACDLLEGALVLVEAAERPQPGPARPIAQLAARWRSPVSGRAGRRPGTAGSSSSMMLASSIARACSARARWPAASAGGGRRCSGPRRGRSSPGWCGRRCGARRASGRRRRAGRCRRRR